MKHSGTFNRERANRKMRNCMGCCSVEHRLRFKNGARRSVDQLLPLFPTGKKESRNIFQNPSEWLPICGLVHLIIWKAWASRWIGRPLLPLPLCTSTTSKCSRIRDSEFGSACPKHQSLKVVQTPEPNFCWIMYQKVFETICLVLVGHLADAIGYQERMEATGAIASFLDLLLLFPEN